jgi:polysaccharide transporter, PST family
MLFDSTFHSGAGFWEAVHNIKWMGIAQIVKMGGSLVVGVFVVRYLGPTQFGTLSYAIAVCGLFNIISNLGLDFLVVNAIAVAKDPRTEEEVLGTGFVLKIVASVITTLAAVAFSWVTHPKDTTTIILVALISCASISQGFDVVSYFYQAKTKSRLTVVPQLVLFVLGSVARLIMVRLRAPLLAFGMLASVEILAGQLGLAGVYIFYQRNLAHWKFSLARARTMLTASWPLLLSSLLIMVYMRTDQVLLGTLGTKAVVGQYSVAVKLSEIWYAIPSIICASVMPRLLRSKEVAPQAYYHRLGRLYDLMATFSIAIAVCVSFAAKYIIAALFGATYLPAASILAVHIWTGPFVFIGIVSGMQILHEDNARISLQRTAVGAIANVGLNLMLIPRFGGMGSAVATLIAQILSAYLLDILNSSTRHIFRMKTRALFGFWIFARGPVMAEEGIQ